MRGLRWIGALLAVPLMAACTEPWRAPGALMPSASPATSVPVPPTVVPGQAVAVEAVSACSVIGLLVTAERGEAAMGYREMVLTVRNCGSKPYVVKGRPEIVVLDEDGRPLRIDVVPSVHWTAAPGEKVLKPGTSAISVLSWRNTVTDVGGGSDTGESLAVAVSAGRTRQFVSLPSSLDLGNTRRLEAGAWF
ncbi:DUF4232 domain-containing protein [Paractinoplanes abujensis]|uniref:DUF4232 domain-containing protein n=1 Tax=Paractinoplanes abujensis TaxID=882441 RepID=A0A7W7CL85_9ACTN|nr:DUF4232 domain-containing protein [Actinoplanes abujensis]MBB4690614.1 hypothetical protein [Actinoplanes abujensis]